MKYQTKLFVVFLTCTVVINGLSLLLMYRSAKYSLFEEIGNNALSIAATTAAFVDGDEHESIPDKLPMESDSYKHIEQVLRKARDANRRGDAYVKYLYTFQRSGADPKELAFGVDSQEKGFYKDAFDAPLRNDGRQMVLDQIGVDREFSKDSLGQFLTANAPVRDSSGKIVAAVGVDFRDSFVQPKLAHLWKTALLYFGLALCLATFFGYVFSWFAAQPVTSLYQTMKDVEDGNFEAHVKDYRTRELRRLAGAIDSFSKSLKQKDALISALTPFVSSQELAEILKTGKPPAVQTERRHITVLFSDIRNFTKTSENMRPEDVAKLLNEYFEKMVEIVFRHHGKIDKFIGDGLMALFGASDIDSYQEENAVAAALEMQQEVVKLSENWSKEGRIPLRIGIGINSGTAIVGNLGSEQRLEYTAIGDTVNLASRLECATKDYGDDILISEYTFNGSRGAPFVFTKKTIDVKGRTEPVTAYAVTSLNAQNVQQAENCC